MTDPGVAADEEWNARFGMLAGRADHRKPGTPPWTWANLTADDAAWLDGALDEFVDTYNRVLAMKVDEVIPRCWRRHPALAQELPVQYWGWWAAHVDQAATVQTAQDYYGRNLPAFQDRLRTRLLGGGAVGCRKGAHSSRTDPDLIDAISFDTQPEDNTGMGEPTRQTLRLTDFAAMLRSTDHD